MKKYLNLFLIIISIVMLAGCGNQTKDSSQTKDKQLIIDTKAKVEEVINTVSKYGIKNQDSFAAMFTSFIYDTWKELEEQYNQGNKVYILFSDSNENGKVVGKDLSDSNKYHIYIGSDNDSKLWSYATVDITTGKITWEDSF